MPKEHVASVLVALAVVVGAAHLLGQIFARLRQPKLVGEILAGVVIGPFVLGRIAPELSAKVLGAPGAGAGEAVRATLGFLNQLGLLLLMFISGSEARRILAKENRKPTAWILAVGTPLPFCLALALGAVLPVDALAGPNGEGAPIRLVLAIAVAVTSIPVISRIFYDLKILHTRFAGLILGAALIEDIALWGVLAVATALGATAAAGGAAGLSAGDVEHILVTIGFMAGGLFVAPAVLRRLHDFRWNLVKEASPTGYATLILVGYAAVAAHFGVEPAFAAFLAGFGLVGGFSGSQRSRFAEPLDAIKKVGTGVFVPIYFAMVGAKLKFGEGFSPAIFLAFLFGSSILCFSAIGLASRLAGFRGLEIVNLAVASNARGGPGIVLASVAYEAQLINGAFFTALVLTAVLTSQVAGAWLGLVLRRGWTLLRDDMPDLRASAASEAEALVSASSSETMATR